MLLLGILGEGAQLPVSPVLALKRKTGRSRYTTYTIWAYTRCDRANYYGTSYGSELPPKAAEGNIRGHLGTSHLYIHLAAVVGGPKIWIERPE